MVVDTSALALPKQLSARHVGSVPAILAFSPLTPGVEIFNFE